MYNKLHTEIFTEGETLLPGLVIHLIQYALIYFESLFIHFENSFHNERLFTLTVGVKIKFQYRNVITIVQRYAKSTVLMLGYYTHQLVFIIPQSVAIGFRT